MVPSIRKKTAKSNLTDDVSVEDGTLIPKGPRECLTVEAVYPSSTRMFLAQLLMCLKRSGPNRIPPYHRDTTTITLRTSRICGERERHGKSEMSVDLRELGKRLITMNCDATPFPGCQIFHTRCNTVDESSLSASGQLSADGLTLQNVDIFPYFAVVHRVR